MDYVFLRFKSFEHAKTFFICVKLWTWKIGIYFYKNPNYYVSLVIIQTCKNVVLKKCPLTWGMKHTAWGVGGRGHFQHFHDMYVMYISTKVLRLIFGVWA
jgi:hypothetical protein